MTHASVSLTRRELLFGMAGSALAFSQPRNQIYSPRLAAHTSFWLREAELRNRPFETILEEAFYSTQRAGYGRVELASDFLSPHLQTRTLILLRKNKLEPAIVDAGGPLYERGAAEAARAKVLETARLMMGLGVRFFNFSPAEIPDGRPKTPEELEVQAYQLNRMGQDLTQMGIGLMVHHSLAELRDDLREWRFTLAHTESPLVSFCLDVDWILEAGLSPVAVMDTTGIRLRAVHLRNPRHGVNQELLRDGDIDMAQIARFLRQSKYDGFLVPELLYDKDTPRRYPTTEALSLSRWYVQEVFGSRPGSPPVDMGPHVRERRA